MITLAVDTALGACSVAVLGGDTVLAHRFEEMARGHAEALAPMVEEAMGAAGVSFRALDRLGVTTGPGTFTGQRVGLAFMRGLRVALKKPLIGVTTLEAMAAATGADRAAAIHDAKRNEAYLSLWEKGATALAPQVMPFGDAVAPYPCLRGLRLVRHRRGRGRSGIGRRLSLDRHPPARCALGGAAGCFTAGARPAARAPLSAGSGRQASPRAKMSPRLFDPGTDDVAELARLHASAFQDGMERGFHPRTICNSGGFCLFSTRRFRPGPGRRRRGRNPHPGGGPDPAAARPGPGLGPGGGVTCR